MSRLGQGQGTLKLGSGRGILSLAPESLSLAPESLSLEISGSGFTKARPGRLSQLDSGPRSQAERGGPGDLPGGFSRKSAPEDGQLAE